MIDLFIILIVFDNSSRIQAVVPSYDCHTNDTTIFCQILYDETTVWEN